MNNQNQQHYIIHQHRLSDSAMIALEVMGWAAAEKNLEVEAYLAEKDGSEKFEARFWRFYQPAMKVVADNLEEVFHAGNGYGRFADQVENIGRAHSCSVGDIVQLGGLFWMVDGHGFKEISAQVDKGKVIVEVMAECDRVISIGQQLEQARNHNEINLVRERIELEIDVEEAKRGYFKSCDILESVYDEDDMASMGVDYDQSVDA